MAVSIKNFLPYLDDIGYIRKSEIIVLLKHINVSKLPNVIYFSNLETLKSLRINLICERVHTASQFFFRRNARKK